MLSRPGYEAMKTSVGTFSPLYMKTYRPGSLPPHHPLPYTQDPHGLVLGVDLGSGLQHQAGLETAE